MSQNRLTPREIRLLQEALSANHKISSIRLREGEYQYELAKAIASFQIKLRFPDVKDIITRLYGEEKTNDIKFIRKIQTILKKMEKGNVVMILPKKKPWELQRYALSSLRFEDSDKNLVVLATDEQIDQIQNLLPQILSQQQRHLGRLGNIKTKILMFALVVVASYIVVVWDLMQPTVDPIIFLLAFSFAIASALMLGKTISHK